MIQKVFIRFSQFFLIPCQKNRKIGAEKNTNKKQDKPKKQSYPHSLLFFPFLLLLTSKRSLI